MPPRTRYTRDDLLSAALALVRRDGMDALNARSLAHAMLPFFKKLPLADILFADFAFSGYALLIVNGLTNLTAAGRWW